MPILNGYLNVKEVAELLGVHTGTVKRLCREMDLTTEKVHNGWLIFGDVAREFAERYDGRRGRPSNKSKGV